MDDGPLRRWVVDRLVPKVVLATQTKVLEAAVDVDGTWVPSTPVIAVHAATRTTSSGSAAVLLAPPVSVGGSTYAGGALPPMPSSSRPARCSTFRCRRGEREWADAAAAVEAGVNVLASAGGSLTAKAYGCDDDVFEWWPRVRLPHGPQ